MRVRAAYIDTSLLIRLRFEEAGRSASKRIEQYERLFAADLLIAEMLSFAGREQLPDELVSASLEGISWILPDRSLAEEMRMVARLGYLRGADLWHLACACFLDPGRKELAFLTRDARQRQVAGQLGFSTPLFR